MHRIQHRTLNRILTAAVESSGGQAGMTVATSSWRKYADDETRTVTVRLHESETPETLDAALKYLEGEGLLALRANVTDHGTIFEYVTTTKGLEAALTPLPETEVDIDGDTVPIVLTYSRAKHSEEEESAVLDHVAVAGVAA
jgi:hypothetical protein